MGIKSGKGTMIIYDVLAVIGSHDPPILGVVDIISLAAVLECNV
jgi:hypothetical protein